MARTLERMSRELPAETLPADAGEARPSHTWIRGVDLGVVLLFVMTAWTAASGGARAEIAGIPLSVTSYERLAFVAAAGLVLRHVLVPRPSILTSIAALRPRAIPGAWRATAPIWAGSRLAIVLAGFFGVLLIGKPPDSAVPRVSRDPLANLPARWDALWYLDIAMNGYRWVDDPLRMQNVAFFPAYPWTMRAGGAVLGAYAPGLRQPDAQRRMLLGGWLAALLTFWAALVYVYRWTETRAGPQTARTTVTLLAAYPFAVFFSAPYSEPLYLLSVTAAFVHFERAQWIRSGAWGFLAALVRPTGVLLVIPLAWMALRWRGDALRSFRLAAAIGLAIAAPVIAVLLHSLAIYQLTGRPFAWSEVQVAWGRTYQLTTWLGEDLAHMSEHGLLWYVEAVPVTVLNALAAAASLALLWQVVRRAGFAYALFIVMSLGPAIASGGLMSVGRFTSTLFPLFFALATVVPERHLPSVIMVFSVLQGLIAVLFFTWRPPF